MSKDRDNNMSEQSGHVPHNEYGRRSPRHLRLNWKRVLPLLMIAVAVLTVPACRSKGVFRPAAVESTPGASFNGPPISVTLPELAANPAAFHNRLIRVSGDFALVESVTCTAHQRGPKMPWGLIADDWQLSVDGIDELTFRLSEGTPMTIDGIFQQYIGPVGCGKGAPATTLWFLNVMQVVQPNPLPLIVNGRLPGAGGANLDLPAQPTAATPLVGVPGTESTHTPTPIVTNTAMPTPTEASGATLIPSASPTATSSTPEPTRPEPNTETPTATPTPTATDDKTEATATPDPSTSATPAPPTPVDTPGGYPPPKPTEGYP